MKKRFLALLLTLCMIVSLLPASAYAAGESISAEISTERSMAAESAQPLALTADANTSVLAFTSDVHNQSGKVEANRLSSWIAKVKEKYGKLDVMAFGGDMATSSAGSSNNYWTYTQPVVNAVSDGEVLGVYTTGNHEYGPGDYTSSTSELKNYCVINQWAIKDGPNYRIYCLGSDSNSQNYTTDQITALADALSGVDNSKPIFIITHFPLHVYNGRTTSNAGSLLEVLNAAATEDKQTIVFLWGHNHTESDTHYDQIYKPGDTLSVTGSSDMEIQFYYGGAGCMSDSEYGTGSASVKGKGLVVTVSSSTMTFAYLNASGSDVTESASVKEVSLPNAAGTVSGYVLMVNGYALSRNTSDDKAGNVSGNKTYSYYGLAGVAFDPESDTPSEDILWNIEPNGDGYTITDLDGNYLNATYISETSTVDGTLKVDGTSDIWTLDSGKTLSDGSKLKSANATSGASGSAKYLTFHLPSDSLNLFSIRSQGSSSNGIDEATQQTVQFVEASISGEVVELTGLSLPESASVSEGNTLKLSATFTPSNASNKKLTWTSSSESVATVSSSGVVTGLAVGKTTITATSQENPALSASCEVTVTAVPTYELVEELVDGGRYIIVGAGSSNKYAMTNKGGSSGGTAVDRNTVTVEDDKVKTSETGFVWTAEQSGDGFLLSNGTDYLGLNSSNALVTYSSAANAAVWTYSNSQLKSGSRYVRYSNSSFSTSSSTQTITIYGLVIQGTDPVDGVSLDQSSAEVYAGGSVQLKATVSPATAMNKKLTWTSSDEAVATVSSSGLVTGVAAGTATIKAASQEDDSFFATCTVKVLPSPIYVLADALTDGGEYLIVGSGSSNKYALTNQGGSSSGASVSRTTVTVTDDTIQTAETAIVWTAEKSGDSFLLSNGSDYLGVSSRNVVSYSSSSSSGSWTYSDGSLKHSGGRYVYYSNSSFTTSSSTQTISLYELVVEGDDPVSGVSLDKSEAEIGVGSTVQLKASVLPRTAANKAVTWSSSDESVATVDGSGMVTGVKAGAAVITVTTEDGGYTATCTVTVKLIPTYKLADALKADGKYLIVNINAAGSGFALKSREGSAEGNSLKNQSYTTAVTVRDDGTIQTEDTDIVWSAPANGDGFYLKNGSDYLAYDLTNDEIRSFNPIPDADSYWNYADSQLKFYSEAAGYVLYYNANSGRLYFNADVDTGSHASDTIYIYEEIELIATYTVTFEDYDGTVLSTATVEDGTAWADVTKPADPSRVGYSFTGWTNAPETVTEDVTVTAAYTANNYSVRFNSNGGSGTMQDQPFAYDEEKALSENAFTRANYSFAGWAESAEGEVKYTDMATVKNLTAVNNAVVDLYAVWTQNAQVTITFKANGGEGDDLTQTVFAGVSTPLDANGFTRTGYSFSGWNTASDGSGEAYADKASVTIDADLTLYAQWTVNEYTITWLDDDDTLIDTTQVAYGVVPTHEDPTKAATAQYTYSFTGWTPEPVAVTGDATYKASYSSTVNEYTVTFKNGDDTLQTDTLPYGAVPAYNGEDPTKEATAQYTYSFSGWTDGANSYGKDAALPAVTGDVTYSAVFSSTVKHYTVTFLDEDGSTPLGTASVNYGTAWANVTKPASTRTGYSISSWQNAPETVTTDVSVTAVYTANSYTLAFSANGGSGEMAALSATYDVELTLPANAFTRTNYLFTGWNTKADGSGDAIDDQATVKNLSAAAGATVTLFAQWQRDPSAPLTGYVILLGDKDGNKLYALSASEAEGDIVYGTGGSTSYQYTGLASVEYDPDNITEDLLWEFTESGSGYLIQHDGLYLNASYGSSGGTTKGNLKVDSTSDVWTLSSGNSFEDGNLLKSANSGKFMTLHEKVNDNDIVNHHLVSVRSEGNSSNNIDKTTQQTVWILEVSVSGEPVAVSDVTVSPETATVKVGKSVQLSATVTPSNASNKKVTWTSSDESVATVDEKGKVKGLKEGVATITATTLDGGKTASCTVTVESAPVLSGYVIMIKGFALSNVAVDDPVTTTSGYYYYGLAGVAFDPETDTPDESILWTVTETEGGYTIQDQSGRYLSATYGATSGSSGSTGRLIVGDTIDVWSVDGTLDSWIASGSLLKSSNASRNSSSDKYLAYHDSQNVFSVRSSGNAQSSQLVPVESGVTPGVKYTVTFQNDDGTVLQTIQVEEGTSPVYTGETPTKAATDSYHYTFAGWSDGATLYTGELPAVTGDMTYIASYTESAHSWVPSFIWAEDYSSATLVLSCACGKSAQYPATVSSVTILPTEEQDGQTVYTASATVDGVTYTESKTVILPALSYTYQDPVYVWAADNSSVTATAVCNEDASKSITETVATSCEVITPALVAGAGLAVYTASFANSRFSTQTKTVILPAVGVNRVSGSTRYDTSLLLADALKDTYAVSSFDSIIIASGESFPDALTGSYLAAVKHAPILLVKNSSSIINKVAAYVKANLSSGGTVYILGGTSSVSNSMVKALSGFSVIRLAGSNRYTTNIEILKAAGVKSGAEILVAQGAGFADSLSVSSTGLPILLVGDKLTAAQKSYLANLSDVSFTIIGGDNSVSASLANELKTYGSLNARVAGRTRYETSILVAERYFSDTDAVILAYAQNYPDGLCAGPLGAALGAPVVLVTSTATSMARLFVSGEEGVHPAVGYVAGGPSGISDEAIVTVFGLSGADQIHEFTA